MGQASRQEGWRQRRPRQALHASLSPSADAVSPSSRACKCRFLTPGLQSLAAYLTVAALPNYNRPHSTLCVSDATALLVKRCTGCSHTPMLTEKAPSQARLMHSMSNAYDSRAARHIIGHATMAYNPTMHEALVASAAEWVGMSDAMRKARYLLHAVTMQGLSQPTNVPRRFVALLRAWRREECRRSAHSEVLVRPANKAGVVARWGGARGTRLQRLRATITHVSDVHVSEVLPDGRVVTLTHCPRPDSCVSASLRDSLRELARGWLTPDKPQHQLPASGEAGWAIYLHFVLYKEAVDLGTVFAELVRESGGLFRRGEDFAVNQDLDEGAVTVQLCSVRCTFPIPMLRPSSPASSAAAEAKWLALVERRAEDALRAIVRVNVLPTRFTTQPLSWRATPCGTREEGWGAQYAILLRAVGQRGRDVAPLIQRNAESVANYYPTTYFGPAGCPFCFYHAAAALERGCYREAIIIVAVLSCWSSGDVPRWVAAALAALMRNVDARPPVMREWWLRHVPAAVRNRLGASKAALLWNVLASCRLHELDVTGPRGVDIATPEPGDFVRCAAKTSGCGDREDSFADALTSSLDTAAAGDVVRPLYTRGDAAMYTTRDVVLPLMQDSSGWSETVGRLACRLGFVAPGPVFRVVPTAKLFRALFVRASGRPRRSQPWIRELVEPPCVPSDAASSLTAPAFTLRTDLDLVAANGMSRQPPHVRRPGAPPARGDAATAALSCKGHSMAERLPKECTVLSAPGQPTRPWLLRREPALLALSFTLPGDCCWKGFVAQFAVVRDERLPVNVADGDDDDGDSAALYSPHDASNRAQRNPQQYDGALQGHEADCLARRAAIVCDGRTRIGTTRDDAAEGNVLSFPLSR